jgi:hypothetical protein
LPQIFVVVAAAGPTEAAARRPDSGLADAVAGILTGFFGASKFSPDDGIFCPDLAGW